VVYGRWSLVGGCWSLVISRRGRWSMVDRRWSVVGGRWSVVRWSLVEITRTIFVQI